MKKLMCLLITFTFIGFTWVFAAPTTISNFTISAPTSTTLRCTFTAPGADADSAYICGADSLIVVMLSSTTTDTTITGLTPHTQYIWKIRSKQTGGTTKYSNLDTLYTAWPNTENSNTVSPSKWMWGARSWLPNNITWDTLYCADATGLDSTMTYWTKEYSSIQIKMIAPHADSSKVIFYVFSGKSEETNPKTETSNNLTGTWDFGKAATDSVSIITNGWQTTHKIASPYPSDHFYIRADGQANNGHTTKAIIRLFRRGL